MGQGLDAVGVGLAATLAGDERNGPVVKLGNRRSGQRRACGNGKECRSEGNADWME